MPRHTVVLVALLHESAPVNVQRPPGCVLAGYAVHPPTGWQRDPQAACPLGQLHAPPLQLCPLTGHVASSPIPLQFSSRPLQGISVEIVGVVAEHDTVPLAGHTHVPVLVHAPFVRVHAPAV